MRKKFILLICLLSFFSSYSIGQTVLNGVVTDPAGLPLQGVSVHEKGTQNGTVTDGDGKFNITVSHTASILTFTIVGYQVVEQNVNQQQLFNIVLNPLVSVLDEVVVTALGIKREQKALGYAVQDIKGDQLAKVKGVDVGTTLTGRISGLRVMNSTEFNRSPSIQLRGMTPILVIDGVA